MACGATLSRVMHLGLMAFSWMAFSWVSCLDRPEVEVKLGGRVAGNLAVERRYKDFGGTTVLRLGILVNVFPLSPFAGLIATGSLAAGGILAMGSWYRDFGGPHWVVLCLGIQVKVFPEEALLAMATQAFWVWCFLLLALVTLVLDDWPSNTTEAEEAESEDSLAMAAAMAREGALDK